MKIARFLSAPFLLFVLSLSHAFAKDLIIYGGSFDPPTLAHEAVARALAQRPDSDLLVMVNITGSKTFHHSAMERALFLSSGLEDLGSRVRIVFQAYSKFGTIPVVVGAFNSAEYERVYYTIGEDVHEAWGGSLPQPGERLSPPKPLHYLVVPRSTSAEQVGHPQIALKNPVLESVFTFAGLFELTQSSTQVRKAIGQLSSDADAALEVLKPLVSEPVREILANERYLREHEPNEKAFFKEAFISRFIELRAKLSAKFVEYAPILVQVSAPSFEPKWSKLAWDEAIVRSLVDAIVRDQGLDGFDMQSWPADGRFAASLLFYRLMETVHPEYLAFAPHGEISGGFHGQIEPTQQLQVRTFPARFSAAPTTAQRHQLASGVYSNERKQFHAEIIARFSSTVGAEPKESSAQLQHAHDPRVVFLAGPPGAGKSTIIRMIQKAGGLELPVLSIDDFRAEIIRKDFSEPGSASALEIGRRTQEEAAAIQGVIWSKLAAQKQSFIVDGTLSATEYFSGLFGRLREQGYKIDIIYVTAPPEQLIARIQERATREHRENSLEHVRGAIAGAEKSWSILATQADFAARIENPDVSVGGAPLPVVKALWRAGKNEALDVPLLECSGVFAEPQK